MHPSKTNLLKLKKIRTYTSSFSTTTLVAALMTSRWVKSDSGVRTEASRLSSEGVCMISWWVAPAPTPRVSETYSSSFSKRPPSEKKYENENVRLHKYVQSKKKYFLRFNKVGHFGSNWKAPKCAIEVDDFIFEKRKTFIFIFIFLKADTNSISNSNDFEKKMFLSKKKCGKEIVFISFENRNNLFLSPRFLFVFVSN